MIYTIISERLRKILFTFFCDLRHEKMVTNNKYKKNIKDILELKLNVRPYRLFNQIHIAIASLI